MMKYLISLLAVLITFSVTGQTNFKPAEDIIRKYARYWSDPSHSSVVNERSLLAPTYQLDSVISKEENGVVFGRAEMDYNDLGHTTQMRQYEIDSNTFNLYLSSIIDLQYEIPGYPSNIYSQSYDPAAQEFVPDLEMEIDYDGSNRVDSIVISIQDPLFGGGFGPFIAVKQVYSGDLLVQTRQWIYVALFGGWLPSSITDFTYDQDDVLTEQISYILDFSTGEIIPESRTTFEYNAQGLQQNVTIYLWEDPTWVPNQQNFFEYYNNETLSSETRLFYNIETDEWENNTRTVYPVENVDFEFPVTNYFWDQAQSAWVATDSTINLLNPSIKWGDVAAPTQISIISAVGGGQVNISFDPDESVTNETRYFLVDSLTGDFYLDYTEEYYYSLFESSAVNPVLPEYLTVTPNPAQEQFNIQLDKELSADYTVYTNTGAILKSGNIAAGKTSVQTSNWLPGIYFVVIRMQDGTAFVHKQMVE
jgi:hypothetical protein